MNKFFHFIILEILFAFTVDAQVSLNKSLGNCRKIEVSQNIFTFHTDNGLAEAIVYSPDVIRIRVEKENFTKTFSYAVVADPQKCKVKTEDTPDQYVIETDSIVLKVQKKPLRFVFYNLKGELINSDDLGFGTSWLGEEVTTYKALQPDERFIGLGEHGGNLDRRGESYINWNSDNPGYNNESSSLYSTVPFYIGLHGNNCYGIFLDNSSRTVFNFGAGNNRFASFSADCGEMNYYFIYHSGIRKIIESYTWLTGRMPMPPLWSLGFQQCRYSYFPQADVLSTAAKFRERNIPVDMIYLDIHYMDHYKLFTWDKEKFPEPSKMIGELKNMNFHLALIIDPGVKVEDGYPVYQDGLKSDIFIKYPDGSRYQGCVWPGWCNFPDFTMPKAREWWGKWVKTYADQGVTGFWNDMNEIAAWGKDVPRLLELNWEGKKTSYREGKNVFGLEMARSSYEGAKNHMNGNRPFVLTRSGYSGLQRYTAIWTGDNQSNDDHMLLGVRLINSLGLSGVTFAGMDIGGYSGNPSSGLYTRWMEIGSFLPMFRAHTAVYTNRAEPWAFGEISEDIVRRYIGFRYQLLPYIYSSFYESTQNGLPVERSLAIDYSSDEKIYNPSFQQQYLFGPAILVAPVKSTEALAKVYLPKGKWFDLFSDKVYEGSQLVLTESTEEKLPLFIKAGSIIPMQKLIESTADNAGDTLNIHLYKGDESNQFVYYEDNGQTYDYQKGGFYKRTISYNPEQNTLEFGGKEGDYTSRFKVIRLILHGFDGFQKAEVDGKHLDLLPNKIRFFDSHFKFADYGPDDTKEVLAVSFENKNGNMSVKILK